MFPNKVYAVVTVAFLLLLITMGLVVNAFVYSLDLRYIVPKPLAPYLHEDFAQCLGLIFNSTIDPRVYIAPGRPVCSMEDGSIVYESLYFTVNLTPGTYTIKPLAGLYINASEQVKVIINVEIPARGLSAYLVLVGEGAVASVNLTHRAQASFVAKPGESYYDVLLYINASRPVRTIFRVGFYASK